MKAGKRIKKYLYKITKRQVSSLFHGHRHQRFARHQQNSDQAAAQRFLSPILSIIASRHPVRLFCCAQSTASCILLSVHVNRKPLSCGKYLRSSFNADLTSGHFPGRGLNGPGVLRPVSCPPGLTSHDSDKHFLFCFFE